MPEDVLYTGPRLLAQPGGMLLPNQTGRMFTGTRGPASAECKINLNYLGERLVFRSAGYDTVAFSLFHVGTDDLVAATLTHRVSVDGINWDSTQFTGNNIVTAAGAQSANGGIVNVQGWPWICLEVTSAAASAKWVRITCNAKVNSSGVV